MQILVGSMVRLHRNENEGRRLAYTLTGREIVSAAAEDLGVEFRTEAAPDDGRGGDLTFDASRLERACPGVRVKSMREGISAYTRMYTAARSGTAGS